MVKIEMTAKAVREGAERIVCIPYNEAQYLLLTRKPYAYTCGVYGWNFDVYDVDGLTITTGCRNLQGRNANNVCEYEERARRLWNGPGRDVWKLGKAEELLLEFAAQA